VCGVADTAGSDLFSAGVVLYETVPLTVNEPLQLSGNGFANTGALRNLEGNNAWQGNISLTNSSRIGVDRDSEVLAITGLIRGSGKGATKVGNGELSLHPAHHVTSITDHNSSLTPESRTFTDY
jgi:fibronectin-binding autotransporter adhesin